MERVLRLQLIAQRGQLVAQDALAQGASHHDAEMLEVDRLGEEVVGAEVQGLHRLADAAVARDDDHRDGQVALLHFLEKVDAVQARQPQVRQDEAVIVQGQKTERLLGLRDRIHLHLRIFLEQALQVAPRQVVIFHNEDTSRHGRRLLARGRGRGKGNVETTGM